MRTLEKTNHSKREFYNKINNSLNIRKEDSIILICAIMIASVGLNMNSTTVVIGAMLISPVMSPIIGLAMGFATYDSDMIKKAAKILMLEVIISLITAAIYFYLSPLKEASSELLARTSPTIWDVIIAIFGGIAGVIGSRKKEANNVVPGVAIATALMPPLCTAGYGFANGNYHYLLGALYLFTINMFFILITTFIGIRIMRIPKKNDISEQQNKKMTFFVSILALIIIIPSIISASQLVSQTITDTSIDNFVADKLATSTVINQQLDQDKKVLQLTVSGPHITADEIKKLQTSLSDYHLSDLSLKIYQVADIQSLQGKDFETYLNQIINKKNSQNKESTTDKNSKNKNVTKENSKIKTAIIEKYKNEISAIKIEVPDDEETDQLNLLVTLKESLPQATLTKMTTAIKAMYPDLSLNIYFSIAK